MLMEENESSTSSCGLCRDDLMEKSLKDFERLEKLKGKFERKPTMELWLKIYKIHLSFYERKCARIQQIIDNIEDQDVILRDTLNVISVYKYKHLCLAPFRPLQISTSSDQLMQRMLEENHNRMVRMNVWLKVFQSL